MLVIVPKMLIIVPQMLLQDSRLLGPVCLWQR